MQIRGPTWRQAGAGRELDIDDGVGVHGGPGEVGKEAGDADGLEPAGGVVFRKVRVVREAPREVVDSGAGLPGIAQAQQSLWDHVVG